MSVSPQEGGRRFTDELRRPLQGATQEEVSANRFLQMTDEELADYLKEHQDFSDADKDKKAGLLDFLRGAAVLGIPVATALLLLSR